MDYIQDIIDFIEDNLHETIHLDWLADKMNFSKYHLSRQFNRKVGFSISQYIQERRFTQAIQKINKGKDTITTIALECGFSSPAYFTKLFKDKYGLSPRAFQKGHHYVNLVDRITLGESTMKKTIEEINTYIFENLSKYETIQRLFANLDQVVLESYEDVNVHYLALTESESPEGLKGHILWEVSLNLLNGKPDKHIIRNTAFLDKVDICDLYMDGTTPTITATNRQSGNTMTGQVLKGKRKAYITDIARFNLAYIKDPALKQEVSPEEIQAMSQELDTFIKQHNNNLSFHKALDQREDLFSVWSFYNKAIVGQIHRTQDDFILMTALVDFKDYSIEYDLVHRHRHYGKKVSVQIDDYGHWIKLDQDQLALFYLMGNQWSDLYNSDHYIQLENGHKDVTYVRYI